MISKRCAILALLGVAVMTGCASAGDDREQTPERFDAISADETLTLTGTEPFWTMVIEGDQLTYSTPENIDGDTIEVSRFAGNNGLGFTGEWRGQTLQIAVTPGACNDGMSDREYPYTATATLADTTLFGCAYSGEAAAADGNPGE